MNEERDFSRISGGVYDQAGQSPYGLYEQPGRRRRTVQWVGAHGGSIALSVLGTAIGGFLLWQGARALGSAVGHVEAPDRRRRGGLSGIGRIANRISGRLEDVRQERRGGWLRRAKERVEDVDVEDVRARIRDDVDVDEGKGGSTFGKIAKALILLAIVDRVRRSGMLKLPRLSELRGRLSQSDEGPSSMSSMSSSQAHVPEMR